MGVLACAKEVRERGTAGTVDGVRNSVVGMTGVLNVGGLGIGAFDAGGTDLDFCGVLEISGLFGGCGVSSCSGIIWGRS